MLIEIITRNHIHSMDTMDEILINQAIAYTLNSIFINVFLLNC